MKKIKTVTETICDYCNTEEQDKRKCGQWEIDGQLVDLHLACASTVQDVFDLLAKLHIKQHTLKSVEKI